MESALCVNVFMTNYEAPGVDVCEVCGFLL